MTAVDEIRARAFGVQAGCPDCERLRSMDDLHRTHAWNLKEEMAELFSERLVLLSAVNNWKFFALSGWLLAAMLMIGDFFKWGN